MNSFVFVIILLRLSLSTAANFTQVFEWQNGMDYEWPSEAKRTRALENGIFKPEKIAPIFMAVYGTRIFISLEKFSDYGNFIPVTLVSLPTSSTSSASPKLSAFPSWYMHEYGGCNKIEEARGLEVDTNGRLWVLDSGGRYCNSKLWTINLTNNDRTKLIHRFSFRGWLHDLVLDETPNDTFAYISRWDHQHIVVYSLEINQSWIVITRRIKVFSIALSPKEEPRQLYFGEWNSNELYSIPVTELRNGNRSANPKLIGEWTAIPYRMLIDSHKIMYAAFWGKNCTSSWNTSQSFHEQRFYEAGMRGNSLPFTFTLDSSGTFWMTELNKTANLMPRYRLLKAAKPYSFEDSTVAKARPTTTTISPKTEPTPASLSIPTSTTTTPESTPTTATASTQIHETTEIIEETNASSTQLPEFNHPTPVNLSNLTATATTSESTLVTTTTLTQIHETTEIFEKSYAPSTLLPETHHTTPVSLYISTTAPESTPTTATTSTQIHETTEIIEETNTSSTQLTELNHTTPVDFSILTRKKSWTPAKENAATEVKERSILTATLHQSQLLNIILICVIVFCVVLFSLKNFWLTPGPKRKNSLPQNTNEAQEMSVFRDNHDGEDENPKSAGVPSVPDECDDAGPAQLEALQDSVATAPSTVLDCEENTPESAQNLKILS